MSFADEVLETLQFPVDPDPWLFDPTAAEQLVQATGAQIVYGVNRPYYVHKLQYYVPGRSRIDCPLSQPDTIYMPHRERFNTLVEFYTILFHELAHWAEYRVGWGGCQTDSEIIADLTSGLLIKRTNVPNWLFQNRFLEFGYKPLKTISHYIEQATKVAGYLYDKQSRC